MAVKAVGKLRTDQTTFEEGNVIVHIDIATPDNGYASDVIAGTFAADALAATINAMLAAFVKNYAAINMGVTFDLGDTARMLDGVQMNPSS